MMQSYQAVSQYSDVFKIPLFPHIVYGICEMKAIIWAGRFAFIHLLALREIG